MEKRRHFFNAHIAGLSFYDATLIFHDLKIGTKLDLEIEPNNKFDAYAVAVYFNKYKLGYIPRTSNKELFKFMEMGYTDIFDIRINRVNPNKEPESQIGISVHILPANG